MVTFMLSSFLCVTISDTSGALSQADFIAMLKTGKEYRHPTAKYSITAEKVKDDLVAEMTLHNQDEGKTITMELYHVRVSINDKTGKLELTARKTVVDNNDSTFTAIDQQYILSRPEHPIAKKSP